MCLKMAEVERKKTGNGTGDRNRFACKQCKVTCSTRYGLAEHVRKHTGDRPFICTQCNASFKRMMGLRKHQQSCHGAPGSKQYNCPDCKFISTTLGNVVRHYLAIHRSLRRFICSICLTQYSQNQELKIHLRKKHSISMDSINSQEKKSIGEVYVLPASDLNDKTNSIVTRLKEIVEVEKGKLKGMQELIRTIKNNREVENTCDDIGPASSNSTEITAVQTSRVVEESIVEEDGANNENVTVEDGIQFSNSSVVVSQACPETWMLFVLEKPRLMCNEIQYGNYVPSEIFQNELEDISSENGANSKSLVSKCTVWRCSICGKSFPEEKKLIRHEKIHSDEKKYECNRCDKSFREQHNLLVHYRTHTEERPYVCPVCEKQIRYHKDFVDHFLYHSGEKRFICDHCPKKFSRKRDRDRHMLSHNSEHRFSCEICGRGFSRRYLMVNHILKHKKNYSQQQEKKEIFECNLCRKQYKTAQRFLQHKTKHTGMTEHQCHVCSKSFTSATRLQAHLRNHIPRVKNVTCSECQRKFSSQDTLKIHMDRFHKPEILIEEDESKRL